MLSTGYLRYGKHIYGPDGKPLSSTEEYTLRGRLTRDRNHHAVDLQNDIRSLNEVRRKLANERYFLKRLWYRFCASFIEGQLINPCKEYMKDLDETIDELFDDRVGK